MLVDRGITVGGKMSIKLIFLPNDIHHSSEIMGSQSDGKTNALSMMSKRWREYS